MLHDARLINLMGGYRPDTAGEKVQFLHRLQGRGEGS